MGIKEIRRLYQEQKFDEALCAVNSDLETDRESVHLWVMRGNLIQLSNLPGLTLEDAEQSYLAALECFPDCVEAMEDLAHFYYAVVEDKHKAHELLKRLDTRLANMSAGLQKIRTWVEGERKHSEPPR